MKCYPHISHVGAMYDRRSALNAELPMDITLSVDTPIAELIANTIRFTVTAEGRALSAELVPVLGSSAWRTVTRASTVWLGDVDILGALISIGPGTSDWIQLLSFVDEGFGPDAGRGLRELQPGHWDQIELTTPDLDHGPLHTLRVALERETRVATLRSDGGPRHSARLRIPKQMLTWHASRVAAAVTASFVLDAPSCATS